MELVTSKLLHDLDRDLPEFPDTTQLKDPRLTCTRQAHATVVSCCRGCIAADSERKTSPRHTSRNPHHQRWKPPERVALRHIARHDSLRLHALHHHVGLVSEGTQFSRWLTNHFQHLLAQHRHVPSIVSISAPILVTTWLLHMLRLLRYANAYPVICCPLLRTQWRKSARHHFPGMSCDLVRAIEYEISSGYS